MNYFTRNIKYLMRRHKMTQADLAKIIDKKRSIVGSYCRGERMPSIDNLGVIARHFDVQVGALISSDIELSDNAFHEPQAPYGPSAEMSIDQLKQENEELKARVTELLEKTVELQDQLIKCMNE